MIEKFDDFKKLKLKLIIFIIFLVFVIISILSYSIYLSYEDQRISEIQENQKSLYLDIVNTLENKGIDIEHLLNVKENFLICVSDQKNTICSFNREGDINIYRNTSFFDMEKFILYKDRYKDYSITIGIYKTGLENELKKLKISIVVSDLLVIFLSGFLAFLVFDRLLKPIKDSKDRLSNILQIVAHDIRTPISIINTNIYIIKKRGDCKSKNFETIEKNVEYIKNLIRNIDYMTIESKVSTEEVDINNLIKDILAKFEGPIKNKKLNLSIEERGNLILSGDRNSFEVLFSNLIDNAIKYNHMNGVLDILIEDRGISIKNSGKPIKDKNRVFEKYYREDSSGNIEGMGLGLSIVKNICKLYGLKIDLYTENDLNIFKVYK